MTSATPPLQTPPDCTQTGPAATFPWKPVEDWLLVLTDEAKTITEAGIHIPEGERDVPQTGIILGWGAKRCPYYVSGEALPFEYGVGDRVMFMTHAGHEVRHEGRTFLFLKTDHIISKQRS